MINDYTELVIEATARSGSPESVNKASMLVSMAEKMLSKKLRTGEMVTSTELTTDSNGQALLPNDFQEIISLYISESRLAAVPSISDSEGYFIEASNLCSYFKNQAHTLKYYASLPSLEANSTNWLLSAEPDIYLQALLFQIYIATNNIDASQLTRSYLDVLINDANTTYLMKKYKDRKINYAKVMP